MSLTSGVISHYIQACSSWRRGRLLERPMASNDPRFSIGSVADVRAGAPAIDQGLRSFMLAVYTGASVARVFFVSAASFGALSLYGYTTKRDLSAMGSFMMMGLFGLIIGSLVNMFLASSGFQFVLTIGGVLIFAGLTAWD